MNICLYGSGSRTIDKIYTDAAYELGCEIAEKGHTLVFGGGDTGMMGACARGVHENDGKSLGIAPEWIVALNLFVKIAAISFMLTQWMKERINS